MKAAKLNSLLSRFKQESLLVERAVGRHGLPPSVTGVFGSVLFNSLQTDFNAVSQRRKVKHRTELFIKTYQRLLNILPDYLAYDAAIKLTDVDDSFDDPPSDVEDDEDELLPGDKPSKVFRGDSC